MGHHYYHAQYKMDKEENHYMIIKDTRCIETRFDDSKQQVCQGIHL